MFKSELQIALEALRDGLQKQNEAINTVEQTINTAYKGLTEFNGQLLDEVA